MKKCICWCLSIIELKNTRWNIEILQIILHNLKYYVLLLFALQNFHDIHIILFFPNNQLKFIWKFCVKVLFPTISVLPNKRLQTYAVKKSVMHINSRRYWIFSPRYDLLIYIYIYIYQNDIKKLNCLCEKRTDERRKIVDDFPFRIHFDLQFYEI